MTGYEVLWTRRSGSIHSCQASPVYRGCIAAMLQQGSGVLYRLLDSGEAAESQGRQCLGTGRAEGIWDIPGVFWRRWQWFPPRGSSWVRAGKFPTAQGLGRRVWRRPDLGIRLCQEEGSPLSLGDPAQEGRAAGGADWARGGSCPGWRGGRARGLNQARRDRLSI